MTHEERILLRLRKKPMTTDQLAKDMRTARSTVVAALNKLWSRRVICVVEYKYTGSTPARIWGIGEEDMPRPPVQTKEQRNARQRERLRKERERLTPPTPEVKKSTARRDIAAAWI